MWLRPLLVAAEVANLRQDVQVAVSSQGATNVAAVGGGGTAGHVGSLMCPAGSDQIGPMNADISGCGLQACEARYDIPNIDSCHSRCKQNGNCRSFSWAPMNGDPNHAGVTVCTIYASNLNTQTWGSQILCGVTPIIQKNAVAITKTRNMLNAYNSDTTRTMGPVGAQWDSQYPAIAMGIVASQQNQIGQHAINEISLEHLKENTNPREKEYKKDLDKARKHVLDFSKVTLQQISERERDYERSTNGHNSDFQAKYTKHKEEIRDAQNKEIIDLQKWNEETDKKLMGAVKAATDGERRAGIRYKKGTQSHEMKIAKTEKKLASQMEMAEEEAETAANSLDWVDEANENLEESTDINKPGLRTKEEQGEESLADFSEAGEEEVKWLAEKASYTVEDMTDAMSERHDEAQDLFIEAVEQLADRARKAIEEPRKELSDVEQKAFQPFKDLENIIEKLATQGKDTDKLIKETNSDMERLADDTKFALSNAEKKQTKKIKEWNEFAQSQIEKRKKQLDTSIKVMQERALKNAQNIFADKESQLLAKVRTTQQVFSGSLSGFRVNIRSMRTGQDDLISKVKKASYQIQTMQNALKNMKGLKVPIAKALTGAEMSFTNAEQDKAVAEHQAKTKVKTNLAVALTDSRNDLDTVMSKLRGSFQEFAKTFNEDDLKTQQTLDSLFDSRNKLLAELRAKQTVDHDQVKQSKALIATVLHQLTFLPGQMQEASRAMVDLLKQQELRVDQYVNNFQPGLVKEFEDAVVTANSHFEETEQSANNVINTMRDNAQQAMAFCEQTQEKLTHMLGENKEQFEAAITGGNAAIHQRKMDTDEFQEKLVAVNKELEHKLGGIDRANKLALEAAQDMFKKITEKMDGELKVIFDNGRNEMRTTVEAYQNKINEGLFEYGQKAQALKTELNNWSLEDKTAFTNMMREVRKKVADGDGTLHSLVEKTEELGHDGAAWKAVNGARSGVFKANSAYEGMRTAEAHVSDELDQMQGRLGSNFEQAAKLSESGREALVHHIALALEKVNIGAEQQRRKADLLLGNADQVISHDTGGLETELKHSTLDAQSRAKLVQTDVKNSLGVLKTEEGKMQSAWMSDKLKIQRKTSMAAEREHAAAGDASIAAHMTAQQADTVQRNAAKLEDKVMHSFAALDPKEQLRVLNEALASFKADQHALTSYEQFAAQQAHDKAESLADEVHHAIGGGLERISALDPRVHQRELDAQRQIHDLSSEAETHRAAIGHVQNDMFRIAYNLVRNFHGRNKHLADKLEEAEASLAQAANMAKYADGGAMEKVEASVNASLAQKQALLDAAESVKHQTDKFREGVARTLENMGVKLDLEAVDEATNATLEEQASMEDRLKAARDKLEKAVREHSAHAAWQLREANEKAAAEVDAISRMQHLTDKERKRRIEEVRVKAEAAREAILTRARTAITAAMKSGHSIDEKNMIAQNLMKRSDQIARGDNGIIAEVDRKEQLAHQEEKLAETHQATNAKYLAKGDGGSSGHGSLLQHYAENGKRAGTLSLLQHYEDEGKRLAINHPSPDTASDPDVGQHVGTYAPPLALVNGQYRLPETVAAPPSVDQTLQAALGSFAQAPLGTFGYKTEPTSFAEVGAAPLLSHEDLAFVTQDVAWALHPSLPAQAADAWHTVKATLAKEAKEAEERADKWQHTLSELR